MSHLLFTFSSPTKVFASGGLYTMPVTYVHVSEYPLYVLNIFNYSNLHDLGFVDLADLRNTTEWSFRDPM